MQIRIATIVCSALIGLAALSSQALAQQKTIKACEDEWRANRAENQAKGITQAAHVGKCRGSAIAPIAPTTTRSAAPAATAPTATTPAPPPRQSPAAATTGANQFSSEALARARCPVDTVVWVNLSSRIYHFAGAKDYGKTKRGSYMCEKDSLAASFRAAKNEKRPS
jgi:hypothetical protein